MSTKTAAPNSKGQIGSLSTTTGPASSLNAGLLADGADDEGFCRSEDDDEAGRWCRFASRLLSGRIGSAVACGSQHGSFSSFDSCGDTSLGFFGSSHLDLNGCAWGIGSSGLLSNFSFFASLLTSRSRSSLKRDRTFSVESASR